MAAKKSLSSTLPERRFLKIVDHLGTILHTANQAASHEKLTAYWRVGELINQERITAEAGYHNSVLRDLAFAVGITARVLQQAVAFQSLYPSPPDSDGLSWTHYRVLIRLGKPRDRTHYARLARTHKWSAKQLEDAIRRDLAAEDTRKNTLLSRPSDPSFIYKVKSPTIIDGDSLLLEIDVGFHIWSLQRVRLAGIDAPEFQTVEGRKAKNFLAHQLLHSRTLVAKSIKTDVHGRFLVHLFSSNTELSILDCFTSGVHINELLVQEKHAIILG